MKKVIAVAFLSIALYGCGNPGIVKMSPDTYMLARQDQAGIFGNAAKMKANVIHEANEFAEKQGKVAIPLSVKESPMWPGHFASIEYKFRVLDKDDPKAISEGNRSSDLYTELTKLDDLLKRGILTKQEFEAQKKLLLEKHK